MWYVYTVEYYSAIERNTFESVLMRWMNLEPIIQSEVSQKEKDKYYVMWNLKYETDKLLYKTETDSDIEKRLVVAKGVWGW